MIYNVRTSVVALVEAATPEAAIRKRDRSLRRHGFDPYDDEKPDAFESEDQSCTTGLL